MIQPFLQLPLGLLLAGDGIVTVGFFRLERIDLGCLLLYRLLRAFQYLA